MDAYAEFVNFEDDDTDSKIRMATRTGRPFGSENFLEMLESQMHQSLKPQKIWQTPNSIEGMYLVY